MPVLIDIFGTRVPRLASAWCPDILWRIPTTERTAYLTFDDGPNPGVTERLMEVLGRFDAAAAFFLLGSHAERYPSLVRDLVDAGHVAGNHTYSHPDAWRSPGSAVLTELDRTTAVLEDISGNSVGWMRPPYGHFTTAMRRWARDRGQKLTMWDVAPGDYLPMVSRMDVERHIIRFVRPGSIVALHDNPRCASNTVEALDQVLSRLVPAGWRFEPLPRAT